MDKMQNVKHFYVLDVQDFNISLDKEQQQLSFKCQFYKLCIGFASRVPSFLLLLHAEYSSRSILFNNIQFVEWQ